MIENIAGIAVAILIIFVGKGIYRHPVYVAEIIKNFYKYQTFYRYISGEQLTAIPFMIKIMGSFIMIIGTTVAIPLPYGLLFE